MKLEDFDYYNEEITNAIYSAMNSTKFLGISGNVAFTDKGDRIAWTQVEQFISTSIHSKVFFFLLLLLCSLFETCYSEAYSSV